MIGVRWARLKIQGFVPSPRLVVLGMHEKRPNADDIGSGGSFVQSILDKLPAQAVPLLALVDRKTSEENYGHRIPGQPLADPSRGGGVFHCSCREAVICNHSWPPTDDIGPGAVGVLVF